MSSLETLEGLWKARPGGLAFAPYAESLHRAGRTEDAQDVLDEGVRRWPRHLAGRLLQGSIAKDRGVPAYLVFPDRSLQEMARKAPRDLEAFAAINGVGAAKLKEFGRAFVDAIATYCDAG